MEPRFQRVRERLTSNPQGYATDQDVHFRFESQYVEAHIQLPDVLAKLPPQPRVLRVDIHSFIVTSDQKLWAADHGTHKILGYDLEGNFLYSWGSWGEYPGGFFGVHGLATDQEGNFYTASVSNGRVQKFVPREGANPEFMVGRPWPSVW